MRTRLPYQESSNTHWWILAFVSLIQFGNYFIYDIIGPVADQLENQLGFSDTQIGTLNAIYSFPNIFLVLIGGVVIDRFGASRVTLWTTSICLAGAVLTAVTGDFMTMAAGRLLFGIGSETMLIAVTVAVGVWFCRAGVAFAMGLSLSIARAGSYAADLSPVWAAGVFERGWQPPLYLSVGFALLSMVAAIAYWWLDNRRTPPEPLIQTHLETERMNWKDVVRFGRSFWYLLALCVLFYAVVVPYRSTFAIKYFQHAHDLSLASAATINSYVYLATIFVTPLFGWVADRFGYRALTMVFGSLLLPMSFIGVVLGGKGLFMTSLMLGISYSLIPAILWPSVVKLVEAKRLGTAYGLLFMLQNAGMTATNLVAGWLNDLYNAGVSNPDGYQPMILFFVVVAIGALAFAIALWRREKGPHSHGLELPGALTPTTTLP